MPNPKRKHSKARRDKRRGGQRKAKVASLAVCSNPGCKKPILPHRVCPYCGYYKGKPVITIKVKEKRKKK